jgi:3-hydroxyisobutyrate dehydrogenase-like beta-hydroxyacid dehydrogenase
MTHSPATVGFIGLGHMGLPMAQRLAASEFPLTAWNRTSSRADPLAATGTRLAGSPSALAAGCDVVITMLSDAGAARAVLCGSDGVLSACRPGTIVVDMSTIGPHAARELAAEAARCGAEFLDAPVSGSVTLAGQGALTVMVGGPAGAFERARPVLAVLSKAQLHLGPHGAGAAMKLAVNLVVAATNQAVAEALALAEVSGIDRAAAYDTLATSAVSSPFLSYKRQAYLSPGGAPVSFTTALMSKDLALAIGVAGDVPLPATAVTKQSLDAACAAGFSDADFASVAQVLRQRAGQAAPSD